MFLDTCQFNAFVRAFREIFFYSTSKTYLWTSTFSAIYFIKRDIFTVVNNLIHYLKLEIVSLIDFPACIVVQSRCKFNLVCMYSAAKRACKLSPIDIL